MTKNPLTAEQRERLRQTLASGSRLGASDLRLINVDVYRERLGADWFKYKTIIHALAAAAIKTELGKEDFFVETKDGYGIFFFKKDLDDVQLISDRIADRLQRELSREPAFGDPPLGCRAKSVNCDDFLRQLEGEERARPAPQTIAAPVAIEATKAPLVIKAPPESYAPLWHTKMERTLGSVFAPPSPPALRKPADKDYYAPNEAFALQDIRSFSAMLADAYKLHKTGQSTTILFSLNFKTFCSTEFSKDYMLALRQTPAALLQYLTPRFVRIPPGTAQTLLAAKVQLLSSIFKHVVLHTRPIVEFQTFEFVSCSILSTSWKDIRYAMSIDPRMKRTAPILAKQFSQSAKTLRLNALITGVDTPEALQVAISAGVEFISGTAVLPLGDAPFTQRPLPLSDIRASHFPDAATTHATAPHQAEPAGVEFI